MFVDLERLYGVAPSAQDHHLFLQAMIKAGQSKDAFKWLSAMPTSYNIAPTVQDFNALLAAYLAEMRTLKRNQSQSAPIHDRVKACLKLMARIGVPADSDTQKIHLKILLVANRPQDLPTITSLLQELNSTPDFGTQAALLINYLEAGLTKEAAQLYEKLRLADLTDAPTRVWNALIEYHGRSTDDMMPIIRQWEDSAATAHPDDKTTRLLVEYDKRPIRTAADAMTVLNQACDAVDRRPTIRSAGLLISRLLEQRDKEKGFRAALDMYNECKPLNLHGPVLVKSILSHMRSMANADLDSARALYVDALNQTDDLDADIYEACLGISTQCGSKGVAWALEILKDMRDDGLTLSSTDVTYQSILALMTAAESYTQAFSAYSWTISLSPESLPSSCYNGILSQFANLAYHQSGQDKSARYEAPPQLFNEILSDMRTAGRSPTTVTYTIMLNYYSRRCRRPEQIRRLHNAIKMDNQYDPDEALYNSLITAYGYVRDFQAAFGVWKSMIANKHRVPISVITISCIIDVCASMQSFAEAHRLWSMIRNDLAIVPNKRNWDGWIECLCRCGAFSQARDVVFREMGSAPDIPSADVQSLETLLSLAARTDEKQYQEALDEAARLTPDLLQAAKLPAVTKRSSVPHQISDTVDRHDILFFSPA